MMEDFTADDRHKLVNDQQFLYNSIKKQGQIKDQKEAAKHPKKTPEFEELEIHEEDYKPELVGSIKVANGIHGPGKISQSV